MNNQDGRGPAGEYRTIQRIATDYLRAAILSGRLGPGAAINQDDVAAELGVSRMPVREALRILAAEGLVDLRPHRQAVVVSLKDDDIAEVFGIRALLESRAVELTVPRIDRISLAELRRTYSEMRRAIEANDSDRWLALNREFHRATYAQCPWPRLKGLIEAQVNVVAPYYRLWSSTIAASALGRHMPDFHLDHERLLRAIEERDAATAASTTTDHVEKTSRELLAFLNATRVQEAAEDAQPATASMVGAPAGG